MASGTAPTEAAAAVLVSATEKTTRASLRFDRANVAMTTLGRSVVAQGEIGNTLTSKGVIAVTMPVGPNANATAVSATSTRETRSRVTWICRAVVNGTSFAIVIASTPCVVQNRGPLRPSARFGSSPVAICGATTIVRPIPVREICGTSVNRVSSRRFA